MYDANRCTVNTEVASWILIWHQIFLGNGNLSCLRGWEASLHPHCHGCWCQAEPAQRRLQKTLLFPANTVKVQCRHSWSTGSCEILKSQTANT